jgi:hypothetical protein
MPTKQADNNLWKTFANIIHQFQHESRIDQQYISSNHVDGLLMGAQSPSEQLRKATQ